MIEKLQINIETSLKKYFQNRSTQILQYNYIRLKRVSYLHLIEEYRMTDQIVCGAGHTCLINSTGMVRLFGKNEYGQCNSPVLGDRRVVQAAFGSQHTCLLLDDGTVRLLGDNEYDQITVPALGDRRVV